MRHLWNKGVRKTGNTSPLKLRTQLIVNRVYGAPYRNTEKKRRERVIDFTQFGLSHDLAFYWFAIIDRKEAIQASPAQLRKIVRRA